MSDSISQKISLTRHPEPAEFRLLAKRHERGAVLPSHEHQTGQLVFALRGTMLVETQQSRWTVPPQRALWIPPHQPHAIQILSDVEMRTVYFHPALFTEVAGFARCNECTRSWHPA
ncbi:AraC family ligand binding domain-containing protein [Pseudomonas sp. R1-6]|uniref:AraC family ligand binding domain-containing protein n=1 Tax=Pseudomonas sp. R1-6 TaxID=2817397 RepID=UPI003DA7D3CD